MGQFALGIRSLLIKGAIFVVMAALLAWALGGTLFPRPSRVELPAATFGGRDWLWRLSAYGPRALETDDPQKRIQWELLWRNEQGDKRVLDAPKWVEVAGPALHAETMYVGGRVAVSGSESAWTIFAVSPDGHGGFVIRESILVSDRLSAEQQLMRLRNGYPLQDAATVAQQSDDVLDPQPNSADRK